MPQGETFWNPYRWVPVSKEPVARATPAYRHKWEELFGRLLCTLETLTPFLIGSSRGDGKFIRSGLTNHPFIPGTSLKGMIRSLAELIGNAAIPFPRGYADEGHALPKAAEGEGQRWKLDIAARMFGYLCEGQVFAGLVRFQDGKLVEPAKEIGPFKIVVGQPRPQHKPFYCDEACRKFYHHHVGAGGLVLAPANITQTRTVYPLPPGVRFTFWIDFENLRQEELALLLYCLVLEENVTVTLSKAALGPEARGPVTLTGPLRHKLGGCKPQGGGSVKISITKMILSPNLADRYRGQTAALGELEGEALQAEVRQRIQPYVSRNDDTMRALRAMLIYCENDPRKRIEYPSFGWFKEDKGKGRRLKPTL